MTVFYADSNGQVMTHGLHRYMYHRLRYIPQFWILRAYSFPGSRLVD